MQIINERKENFMFTMTQLVAHLVGDYVLQTGWMALEKERRFLPAFVHAITYGVPFLFLDGISATAWVALVGIHFLIDRYAVARWVCWAKNQCAPKSYRFAYDAAGTGFHPGTPDYLSKWLLIIVDNTMHLVTNGMILWLL